MHAEFIKAQNKFIHVNDADQRNNNVLHDEGASDAKNSANERANDYIAYRGI